MKSDIKTNIRKVATLMLALLGLVTLLSLMPEHNHNSIHVQGTVNKTVAILHH